MLIPQVSKDMYIYEVPANDENSLIAQLEKIGVERIPMEAVK